MAANHSTARTLATVPSAYQLTAMAISADMAKMAITGV